MKATNFNFGLVSDSSSNSSFLFSFSSLYYFLLILLILYLILSHFLLLISILAGWIHDIMKILRFNTNAKEGNIFINRVIYLKINFKTSG